MKADPAETFYRIYDEFGDCFLLESLGRGRLSSFSYLGFSPVSFIRLNHSKLSITKDGRDVYNTEVSEPLETLRKAVSSRPGLPKNGFFGGLVGYISYDSVRYWEDIDASGSRPSPFPEMEFGVFDDWIVFNHREKTVHYVTLGEDRYEQVKRLLCQSSELATFRFSSKQSSFSDDEFLDGILKAKEYISRGDIFQVVLSRRYEYRYEGDLRPVYQVLRRNNPSPYMFFIKFNKRQLVGSSPEMLVKVQEGVVETYPIAGTRRRSDDLNEDAQLRRELLKDQKERAEHIMLVDLARNDIGKVSRFGTVKVRKLLQVRRYSHVQHLVSHVVGELANEYDAFDALRATFPAGTVTGAPKPRAMEVIYEIERLKRGPYGGAVGYFSYNGNADFGIAIRTLFADTNRIHLQAGAGIVADSKPESEVDEVESKLRVLYKAMREANGVSA
ncbi:MAG: anthranilate synthase component I family protein [Conexivisphaerales archaeon]